MRVTYENKYQSSDKRPAAVALGTFDGIHMGHRVLLAHLAACQKYGMTRVVYTFSNHPMKLLSPGKTPPLLMLQREKIHAFAGLGVDLLSLNAFDEGFARQSPEDFIELIKHAYNMKTLIVGYNFRFGYKGAGTAQLLKQLSGALGFDLTVVPPITCLGDTVSSSRIRGLIQNGRIREANCCMQSHYSIGGNIVRGRGRGRILGFPTANLRIPPQKVLPKYGVYITQCRIWHNTYLGLTSVGINPTFDGGQLQVETYMPDVNRDLYGEYMRIYFLDRLRDEIKFESPQALTAQIERDVKLAKIRIYKFPRMWYNIEL